MLENETFCKCFLKDVRDVRDYSEKETVDILWRATTVRTFCIKIMSPHRVVGLLQSQFMIRGRFWLMLLTLTREDDWRRNVAEVKIHISFWTKMFFKPGELSSKPGEHRWSLGINLLSPGLLGRIRITVGISCHVKRAAGFLNWTQTQKFTVKYGLNKEQKMSSAEWG